MANRIIEVPETRCQFQVKGVVGGVEKDNFYKEIKTRTGSEMRCINFYVDTNKEERVYISLTGLPRDKVYFYKKGENGAAGVSKDVAWDKRFDFNAEGFNLIGIRLGLEKAPDENGKLKNVNETYTEYDACPVIGAKLKDGMSVFIKGNVVYSEKSTDDGVKRYINLTPNQISLCRDDIDFDEEDFEKVSDWEGTIVYNSIKPIKDEKGNVVKFLVDANIVGYNDITSTEFYIDKEHEKLADTFRKKLKGNSGIFVSGDIRNVTETEDEDEDDEDQWGDESKMNRTVSSSHKTEFYINGAKPSTIDTESFSADKMQEALEAIANSKKAESDYEGKKEKKKSEDDDWGNIDEVEDEDLPW